MYKLYTKGPNLKTREQRLEWALYRVVEAVEQQRGALEYALQVLNENGDGDN